MLSVAENKAYKLIPLLIIISSLTGDHISQHSEKGIHSVTEPVAGEQLTVFTTSPDKVNDAKKFGATNVVINKEGADYSAYNHTFDFALHTIPYKHNIKPFIPLLKRDATFCRVGVGKVSDNIETGQMSLVLFRNAIAGSNTGGIRETRDMINFCALNKIKPEITKIPMNGIDNAWKNVVDKKVRYRYVIDVQAV